MPTQKTQVITFNNLLLSGDQTLTELTNSVSADAGTPPRVANIVRDADGRLIQLQLNPPDTTSQSAIDAINNHAGVAQVSTCFPEFSTNNLNASAPDGIVVGNGFPALPSRFEVRVLFKANLGPVLGILSTSGYTDLDSSVSAETVLILISGGAGVSATTVIPIGATITLNITPTLSQVFTFTKELTLIQVVFGSGPQALFYVDDQGSLFARNINSNGGTPDLLFADYNTACEDPSRAF